MKNFLFPFSLHFQEMKKFWWHRLFVVLFVLSVLTILFGVWLVNWNEAVNKHGDCISAWLSLHEKWAEVEAKCLYLVPSTQEAVLYFLAGISSALVSSYGLQILYYKVILYIVFGGKPGSPSTGTQHDSAKLTSS